MGEQLQKLCGLLRRMPFAEGANQTPVPYLTVWRSRAEEIVLPAQGLYLYFPAEGSMRLHTPSGILDYVAGQISVSAIDTPFRGEVVGFSAHSDFLAVSVAFTAEEAISVVLACEGDLAERILRENSAPSERAEEDFAGCLARLFSLFEDADSLSYLAGHIKRELLFCVLRSACGKQFLQSIINISEAGEIYEANDWIKRNFRADFTVEELAKARHMSVSGFHQKFKSAVGMGPLQCQKRLRLTEARRQMLNENAAVTDAALDVGYESLSQFIRDYKKMFGASPKDDISALRKKLRER